MEEAPRQWCWGGGKGEIDSDCGDSDCSLEEVQMGWSQVVRSFESWPKEFELQSIPITWWEPQPGSRDGLRLMHSPVRQEEDLSGTVQADLGPSGVGWFHRRRGVQTHWRSRVQEVQLSIFTSSHLTSSHDPTHIFYGDFFFLLRL